MFGHLFKDRGLERCVLDIAQLVEQHDRNVEVSVSNPALGRYFSLHMFPDKTQTNQHSTPVQCFYVKMISYLIYLISSTYRRK